MAVCNLFKEIDKETGSFLTFSQYTEDLTKFFTQPDTYHVIPSKFVAINIDYKDMNNKSFPTMLQNWFENGCAFLRKELPSWNPDMSKNLFWNALYESNLINENSGDIVYVGDINLESYDVHDGMGYSEIYCHIPNDAQKINLEKNISTKFTTKIYNNDIIQGWDSNDYNEENMLDFGNGGTKYKVKNFQYVYDIERINFINQTKSYEDFTFNTIVVLYDIKDSKQGTIYSNIPMGIYLTGLIQEDGTVSNIITKYCSSTDIYGSGTSYGLRICSRFSALPNSSGVKVVTTNYDNNYAEFSKVLSEMSLTISKMNEVVSNIHGNQQNIKETLANIKNNRTNVPYIKEINGKDYWFINGRMISERK